MSAVTVIHRLNRRLNKACRLMVDFLGVRVVILGSIPVAYWLIKRLPLTWKGKPLSDLSLLVVSYLIVGGGVYVWKFIEAGRVLKAEDRISHPRKKYVQNKLAGFSLEEKKALANIVITGRGPVGPVVYNSLDAAGFIERDMVGVWKINKLFESTLEEWLKDSPEYN